MNQVVQRIGRVIRKTEHKDTAWIYTIYLSQTHDSSTLKMVKQATEIDKEKEKKRKRQESNDEIPKPNRGLDKYFS
jgi:superfamily II DNA or RNA helicase